MTYLSCRMGKRSGRGAGDASHQTVEISACEGPFEGGGDLLVVVLEAENALGDFVLGSEVSGRESFALEDREVDLDLVEPADSRAFRSLIPREFDQ